MAARNGRDARVTDEAALPSVERLAYLLSGDLEDDDLPLWEIVWQLTTTTPDARLADKLRLARRAISQLGDECELRRGTWRRWSRVGTDRAGNSGPCGGGCRLIRPGKGFPPCVASPRRVGADRR